MLFYPIFLGWMARIHPEAPLRSRGLAIDAYAPAVAALRRTAVSNQMEERLDSSVSKNGEPWW